MPAVTKIPATKSKYTATPIEQAHKRRVAGYARVSTDKDEQYTSYAAQVDYYEKNIRRNPDWEFVHVYTDEGISGLSTAHRDGFNQMRQDALAGKIDLIVTKSVSRFARNTVDSLVTIRELKDHGVEVYFEEQNIWTFDGKGELMLTIMASLAQEESRSISENVTWGQRKRFADGKLILPYKHFLGYDRGKTKDAPPVVNIAQAAVVRWIYQLFLAGKTPTAIARQLTEDGFRTPAGKDVWSSSTVKSILTNEKYKGDALLQKKYTVDFLQKKCKRNEGEVPQYYVHHSHEAIIPPDVWDRVQEEMQRRKTMGKAYRCSHPFSAKIICADCGGFYGPKVWNSTDRYRRTIWQCNNKFKCGCTTPHLEESDIRERFIQAFNTLFADEENVIANAKKQESNFLLDQFIHALTKHDHPLTEWDEAMWQMTVDTVTVHPDGKLLFRFQDGTVIEN